MKNLNPSTPSMQKVGPVIKVLGTILKPLSR